MAVGGRRGLLISRRTPQCVAGRPRQRHPPGPAPVRHWQAPAEASLRAKEAGNQSIYGKGVVFYLQGSTLRSPVDTRAPEVPQQHASRGATLWAIPLQQGCRDAQVRLTLSTQAPDSAGQAHEKTLAPILRAGRWTGSGWMFLVLLADSASVAGSNDVREAVTIDSSSTMRTGQVARSGRESPLCLRNGWEGKKQR